MANTKFHKLKIVGRRGMTFPMDQMRYDAAWPDSSLDAAKIEAMVAGLLSPEPQTSHFTEADGKTVVIYVMSASPRPNFDRWRSFGWEATYAPNL